VLQTTQSSTLAALRAIQQFLDKYAERLGVVVKSGSRRQLDQAITDLASLAASQAGSTASRKGASARLKELRDQLVTKNMMPLARLAAVDLPRNAELSNLAMPKGNLTVEKLVSAARGMATTAAKYASILIDAGLPATFIEDLNAAADAYAAYAASRKGGKAAGSGATKGLKGRISEATRVISGIDGLMLKNLDAKDPADATVLAEWKSVKKVRRSSSTTPPAPPAPVPIPPPTQTPPAKP
jgi:hypothetical protein